MNEPISLRHTIAPKSDQLNSDDLLSGPITVCVSRVTVSNSPEQPVSVHYEGDNGKPYKPCKSMRKVMIFAWGDDGREWVGRMLTLYNDPEVKFGGVKVGGIRISHMSHIPDDIGLPINETKGKKKLFTVRKMANVQLPANESSIDEALLQSCANKLTEAAHRGKKALTDAGATIPAHIVDLLKDHFRSLMPVAVAADAKQSEGDQLRGFNAAQPLPDEPLPVQQQTEQPQAPQEQF